MARSGGLNAGVASPTALAVPVAGEGMLAAVAFLVPAFFFFYGLNAFPLRDNNEGLYAGIARDMLASGQFIVPHLNGLPYLEKPPLLYWLMSLSMALFGPSVSSARAVSAAAMASLAIALFLSCRRHGHARAGCYASAGLASALPVLLLSHTVLFDPLLTALCGACLLSFLQFQLSGGRAAWRWCLFWLGLAVLAKGAVALVLAAGIAGATACVLPRRQPWRALADAPALLLFLVPTVWWHGAAAWRQDGYAWFYFVNEHVLRFLGRREPHDFHGGPWYYYGPRLLAMAVPWTPFLVLLAPFRARGGSAGAIVRLCVAWLLVPLLFFSLSQAKADYYLMVTAPALAMWLGLAVEARIERPGDAMLAACWGMSAATCVLGLLALDETGKAGWHATRLWWLMPAWTLFALAAGWLFASLRTVRQRHLALLAVVLAVAPLCLRVFEEAQRRSPRLSSEALAQAILAEPGAGRAVFVYRDFEDVFASLPFYLGREVTLIDSASSDLRFGCASPTGGQRCITARQFRERAGGAPLVVAVSAARAAEFQRTIAEADRWRVLVLGPKLLFFRD